MRYCESCGSAFQWMRSCPRDGVPTRADLSDPLLGSVLGERYRVLERIGAGGMGQVYRSAHVRIASLFAVKVLYGDLAHDPQMRGRFEREAEVASLLQSRHIVRVADFGETPGGLLYLAMEYLDGIPLGDRIAREGALAPALAIAITRQIARGLAHAHERGVVHRDLKPDNVMLVTEDDEPDVVRLLDFGLARMRSATRLTRAGQVFGTPIYMAPEQFGDADVDARADLYSLGVILFEMLTGSAPFESDSLVDLARRHMSEPVPPLRERRSEVTAPSALEDIVQKLLAKSPEARFPSARALLDALRSVVVTTPVTTSSAPASVTETAVPSTVNAPIYEAIVVGAPTYNDGDHAGCFEIYRIAAEDLLAGPLADTGQTAARARLDVALRRAAASESPTGSAWELRNAFDDLLHGAQTQLVVRSREWAAIEIARLGVIAAPRYAGGELELLADYYLEFVTQLAARIRRQGGAIRVAESLEASLGRARTESGGARALATLGEALDAVSAGRSLGPIASELPTDALAQCAQLDTVAQRLVQAIAAGAPAYNEGDHAGCQRIYRHAAESLLSSLGTDPSCAPLRARLRRALEESAPLDATAAAWALRHAFDEVLAARGRTA